jgi:hypothetical protein
MLNFFYDKKNNVLRPLTNNNLLIDFHKYKGSPYYNLMVEYLEYTK